METTIEFHEVVENTTIIIDEVTDSVSLEIIETNEVTTFEFQELGAPGITGKSNYQIAADNGFSGTELEWLDSQKNLDGGLIF